MKRLAPWLLPLAVYGGLIAVTANAPLEWVDAETRTLGVVLVLLYAGVTLTFGPWGCLALAILPALWIGLFALFMDSDAFDCYPGCTTYQDVLGMGLGTAMTLIALVAVVGFTRTLLALWQTLRRHGRHRPGAA